MRVAGYTLGGTSATRRFQPKHAALTLGFPLSHREYASSSHPVPPLLDILSHSICKHCSPTRGSCSSPSTVALKGVSLALSRSRRPFFPNISSASPNRPFTQYALHFPARVVSQITHIFFLSFLSCCRSRSTLLLHHSTRKALKYTHTPRPSLHPHLRAERCCCRHQSCRFSRFGTSKHG